MPAAAAAPPELIEFEVGGRWWPAVERLHPDHIIGLMRRAQQPPVDQFDPALRSWLGDIFTLLVAACEPDLQAELVDVVNLAVQADPNGATVEIADAFAALMQHYSTLQLDEVRDRIVANEAATAAPFPDRPAPVRRRTSLAELERIQAKHGRKRTGVVIRPGE